MEEKDERYYATEFARQLVAIRKHPEILDTKEKLRRFWELVLRERNQDKSIQEFLATEAARQIGIVDLSHPQDEPYRAVVLQFLHMDHMHEDYGKEADDAWDKLASMVTELR